MTQAKIWSTATDALANATRSTVAPLAWDPNSLLLSRFTFGPTAADRAALATAGVDAWWQSQLDYARAHSVYDARPDIKAACPLLQLSPADLKSYYAANPTISSWLAMDQLTNLTIGLQLWSPAQLYETVVDFFANHLNVQNHNGDLYLNRHTMDRDVIRPNALGTFTDMLLASCRNPAMLTFLSQNLSTKSAINENLGRELLELHTVGVGNYSEDEVKASARILTGRTMDANGNYVYKPTMHWTGPVQVLGFSHPNTDAAGGEAVGDAYLRYLAMHPLTATRIARKLCIRFVSDSPSSDLVNAIAQVYLANNSAIEPTLRAIVHSSEFWSSRGKKLRRPAENLYASARVLNLQPATGDSAGLTTVLSGLHWALINAGHCPLEYSAPPGYPDVAAAWRSSSTLINIWMWHRGFVQNWWKTWFSTIDVTTLYAAANPTTSGAAIDAMARTLLGQPMTAAHQASIQAVLAEPATTLLTKSSMRWYSSYVAALILDSPYHALR